MASIERKKIVNPNKQSHIVAPRSRNTITVGCKLPHGMHLDIRQAGEPVQRVTLKGINSLTQGAIIRQAQIGGFAVTENVSKEFFEEWIRQNKEHPAVKNSLIFAHVQTDSVRDMAEDRDELKHGFEPIDPAKPGKGIETRKDLD